jgi:hypothetical protein
LFKQSGWIVFLQGSKLGPGLMVALGFGISEWFSRS